MIFRLLTVFVLLLIVFTSGRSVQLNGNCTMQTPPRQAVPCNWNMPKWR